MKKLIITDSETGKVVAQHEAEYIDYMFSLKNQNSRWYILDDSKKIKVRDKFDYQIESDDEQR